MNEEKKLGTVTVLKGEETVNQPSIEEQMLAELKAIREALEK